MNRDSVLVCDIYNFKDFQGEYDINLVGSGNPDKYAYETPHEYLSGW